MAGDIYQIDCIEFMVIRPECLKQAMERGYQIVSDMGFVTKWTGYPRRSSSLLELKDFVNAEKALRLLNARVPDMNVERTQMLIDIRAQLGSQARIDQFGNLL